MVSRIAIIVSFLYVYGAAAQFPSSWSYSGNTSTNGTGPGPDQWASRGFPDCASAKQSPVDIPANPEYDKSLTSFQFHGYDSFGLEDMEIANYGWTAMVNIKPSSFGQASFTGGGMSHKYVAKQLHFHWQSDHTLQGQHYPLELHVVHFKEPYADGPTAMKHSDGMAALAFFFEISDTPNEDLAPFFEALGHIRYKDEKQPFRLSFDKFMTNNTSEYYRYHGSMTHPPCKESVTWTIFKHTNTISSDQLEKLRHLHYTYKNATEPQLLTFNHRPIRQLGDRKVRASFATDSGAEIERLTYFGLILSFLLSMIYF